MLNVEMWATLDLGLMDRKSLEVLDVTYDLCHSLLPTSDLPSIAWPQADVDKLCIRLRHTFDTFRKPLLRTHIVLPDVTCF